MLVTSIRDRWERINKEIDVLCGELNLKKPTVIAVSKTRSHEELMEAINVGIMDFGENNPQEFRRKSEEFPEVNWHFIGHLQSNNVRDVVPTVYRLHDQIAAHEVSS